MFLLEGKLTRMHTLVKALTIILTLTSVLSCVEKTLPPTVSTNAATEISTTSVVSGGSISDDGGAPIISKGICWNTADIPTIDNNKIVEPGESLSFTSNLSVLTPGTTYFIRAYAVNSAGTSYGNSVSFKTLGDKPVLNAQNASNIQLSSATINGTVNPNSLETTITFEYGLTTSYGSSVTAQQSPLDGDSDANASADLTQLSPGTVYHFRISATNELGTTMSNDMTFRTLGDVPSALLGSAINLQYNSAALTGYINPNYLSTTIIFEYGTTTNYGNTISIVESFTGNDSISVGADLSGLVQGTSYHVRIKATNELGTTNSNDLIFTTLAPIIDVEGNTYNIRTIGSQVWMTENLKTTKYSDGTSISFGLYYPDNDNSKVDKYGLLYDWAAAIKQPQKYDTIMLDLQGIRVQGVCPTNWHLPNENEWMELIDLFGGKEVAGLKLKIANPGYWLDPLNIQEPLSGFNAIPAGMFYGEWSSVSGGEARYWTTNQWFMGGAIMGRSVLMIYFNPNITINYTSSNNQPGSIGLSVRCLKNQDGSTAKN